MPSTSADLFPQISGYEIVEQLYLGARTAVYRAVDICQKRSVVIKILRRDYPSFGELVQFRNQYSITKNLPITGIIHPLKLETVGNSYALVMEDWQGVALGKYIQQPQLELSEVLKIAIQLADILHELCQHRVIHKDIKPANILINPDSKEVKLIDFSIASLLPKETQEIQNPNVLEGTLAYIAPEQTGRMNRGIDYRTDFYALGVTLYQLLSGTLPFTSDDPLELMHSHIAKMPAAIGNSKDVPEAISNIVMKLMAKNAEDRYQSALGLKYDLEQCLIQFKRTGKITEFELGQRDLSDRFLIPEKLYGRQEEVAELLAAFDRISQADGDNHCNSEMMLVAGFSGIGKTAVINEVHKPIVRQRGYFIKGKFDQFNRNIPLSAFVQALRDLMGQLLCESDNQIEQWKDKILEALGENGQVLIEVIPELEFIIDSQPSVAELSGSAAQNRFNLLFQKFIAVFTTAEHPLVIFLDDLQWADSASLQFIKLLMQESSYLLMLGAYRDNEVSPVHPFVLTIEALNKSQIPINTITLKPLAFEDINHLVADTLHCSVELAHPLTKLINRKTKGNPFFTTQFLKVLHEEGYINFDYDRCYWQCDLSEINTLAISDDVVEFMALQLQKLPLETQQILKLAACIGNQFDLKTLAIVSEQSSSEIATLLWKALQQELIQPKSQIYKFFQGVEESNLEDNISPKYRFLHDRVQQAAYSLIPEDEKQQTHLKIGRLLLQNYTKKDYLFEILSHFNTSLELINDIQEKQLLSRLNFEGCQRAKLSTAHEAAAQYAQIAMSLLPSETWLKDYQFTLELYQITAELAYLQTDFTAAEALAHQILQQTQQPIDRSRIYELLVQIYIAKDEQVKAIETGLEALKILDISLVEATNWQENLPPLPSDEILQNKPSMTQPNYLAALQILITIIPPTHHVKPELFPSVVLTMVELCDRAGYSGLAAYTYGIYGLLLCAVVGDLERAHTSGQISLQLLEKYPNRELRSKVNMLFAVFVCACKEPGQNTLPLLKQGIETGLAVGDIEYVSYSIMAYFTHLFLVGHHLKEIESSKQSYLAILEQFKQEHCIEYSKIWLQLTIELESSQELESAAQSKTERLQYFQKTHNHQCLFAFHLTQLISCYLFGNYSQGLNHAVKAIESEEAAFGVLLTSAHTFYYSLTLLASINPQLSKYERDQHLKQVIANQIKLKRLADCAPENYLHKYQLIAAEIARIREQPADAISLYEQAIAGAKTNGYTQELALAYELAARFYIGWDKEKIAAGYMQDAYYSYIRWGAKAKVLNLEHYYPHLLSPILQQQPVSLSVTETASIPEMLTVFETHATQSAGSTNILATLDLTTVLKASQMLSSEIELDKLLATLLQTVLESAGADKGVLLMPHEQNWYIEAVATIEQLTQVESILLADYSDLPHSLINTIKRNLESVVIINATTHPTLSTDDYIVQQQPKSILCTPILHQGKLVAILYLENQVSVGAFTRSRVELLNFLCTQAAISLENARLYSEVQESQRQLTTLFSNIPGMAYSCANDEHWTMYVVSEGCYTLTGYHPEEFIGNRDISYAKLIHPDDEEMVNAAVENALQAHQPFKLSYRIRTKDGEEKWVWEQGQGVFDDAGNLLKLEGLVIDISDRKIAEAALVESEAYHRSLFDTCSIGLALCKMNGELLYANAAYANILGRTPAELPTLSYWDITPEKYAEAEQLQLQSLETTGRYGPYEKEYLHKDGHLIPVRLSGILVERNGERFIWSSVEDISDRIAAESQLHENELFLRSIYEGVGQGICVIEVTESGDFYYIGWNPMLERITNIQSQAAIGTKLEELFGETHGSIIRKNYQRCVQLGSIMSYEEMVPFQGKQRWWLTTLHPLKNEADQIYRIILTTVEITDRKVAENLLEEKNEALENALTQLQQSQAQVVQAEKMSALGNLVAGIAHEINNPLGFLNGSIHNAEEYVQDLLEHLELYQQYHPKTAEPILENAEEIDLEFLQEDLLQLLESMKSATDRIKNISTSLRTFSRADTEHQVSANLHEGIDSTLLILKYRLKASEYRPEIAVIQEYGHLPEINCFPGQLNQVFMNIFANAIDMFDEMALQTSSDQFKEKPQTITIQTEFIPEQNTVKIYIRDNGRGMTEAIQARIFEQLFTTKAVGKGTGLGLAIARQIIVEKHHGQLLCNSTVGTGTEFIIQIPV